MLPCTQIKVTLLGVLAPGVRDKIYEPGVSVGDVWREKV